MTATTGPTAVRRPGLGQAPEAVPAVTGSDDELSLAIARDSRRARRLSTRDVLLAVFTPVVLLLLWQLAAKAGWIDARLFTPPSEILARGWELSVNGKLWANVVPTVGRLAVGLVLGSLAGVIAGLFMGAWRPLRAAVGPTFTALYALPKIAILPLLLLIFGITETPKILAVGISVFFVVQINTLAGIAQIDARILEAAHAYRASGWKLFRYILLPAAVPSIMTGLRVAAGMAVVVVTAVEFVASNNGLGYLIWNSWQLFQPQDMYVGLITVSLLGALVTGLIIVLERLLLPWKYPRRTRKRALK